MITLADRIGVISRGHAIQIHAAVEFEQNVLRRAIGPRRESKVGSARDARNGKRIGIAPRDRTGHAVWIEVRIAVGTVLAQICHGGGRQATLENCDWLASA